MHRMIKGKRTALTYKVKPYYHLTYWLRAEVYEPYMKRPFFGLLPARLAYRFVYDAGRGCEIRAHNPPLPEDIQRICELSVDHYERWKLSWEKHNATTEIPE